MAQVKATQQGYYENKIIIEGEIFSIDDKFLKKDAQGKLVSPKWVEIVSDEPILESKNVSSNSKESKKSKDSVI